MPVQPSKPDDKDNEALAAGAAGNQAMVVFILEGDRESATIPEVLIETVTATDFDVFAEDIPGSVAGSEAKTETVTSETAFTPVTEDDKSEVIKFDASDVKAALSTAEKGATPVAVNTDNVNKANVEPGDINETGQAAGEVMARTPITRTSQQHGSEDNDSESSKYGDPGPLENENDTAPVRGHKEKSYSETANVIREKAENADEPVAEAHIPLTEGIKPESYRADQQMRQTSLNAPVRAENLFEEMVSRIEMMQNEEKQAMTIQLKPDFLGKVALEIAMDAAGLHVRINAADGDVRSMINGQIAALIESLENKGIAVVEVEVAYTGIDNGAFKDSHGSHTQPENPRRFYHEADPVDGAAYYSALPYDLLDYYIDEGLSSVEYRA